MQLRHSVSVILVSISLSLGACGASDEAAPEGLTGRSPSEAVNPTAERASSVSSRPFQAPLRIEQIEDVGGRLRLRVVASQTVEIAEVKVWGAEGVEVLSTDPDLSGHVIEARVPVELEVAYRLGAARGHVAVALVTAEQPEGRKQVQSFAVGAKPEPGATRDEGSTNWQPEKDGNDAPRRVRSVRARER